MTERVVKITLPVRSIFKPAFLSMLAVFASLAAWLFPSFGVLHKGFDNQSVVDFNAVVVVTCWYLLIFTSFYTGQKIAGLWSLEHLGSRVPLLSLDSSVLYFTFSALATLGMGSFVYTIFQTMTLAQAFVAISIGQTNALIIPVFQDYHVGLNSLRYVVMYPASLAVYRMIRLKKYSLLDVFNVVLLALSAFLSFRLILIASIVAATFLVGFGKETVKLSVVKLAFGAFGMFFILSVLNYSRNAAYYETNKLSFGLAGVNEIVAYLGTPFQVAIGSVNVTDELVAQGPGDPTHSSEPYRKYVSIGINYNTNSAFVALHEEMGYWCWPFIAALCTGMGALFTLLTSFGRTYFLLPCGAILYASSELWRLDLFETGTFLVWIIVGMGLPSLVFVAASVWRFSRKLYRTPEACHSPE